MVTVDGDPARVEARLVAGRLRCPDCAGVLAGWGHGVVRVLRAELGTGAVVRPRRTRCGSCGITHVLLPARCLLRRGSEVGLVWSALVMRGAGKKLISIAAALRVPVSTARDWVTRLASRAEALRCAFMRVLPMLDPGAPGVAPGGSALADALGAIGAAAAAARAWDRALATVSTPELACHLSGGRLLAPGFDPESINTSSRWRGLPPG